MSSPRIVLEQSGHALTNLGDWAMLEVAIRRIRQRVPDAKLYVVASESAPLEKCVPGVRRFNSEDRDCFLTSNWTGGRLSFKQQLLLQNLLLRIPMLSSLAIRAKGVFRSADIKASLERFRRAKDLVDSCDAVMASGGGYLTDSFAGANFRIAALFHEAHLRRKSTALFGWAMGPINSSTLGKAVSKGLREIGQVSLREGGLSLKTALELGIPPERIVVTGDDATELGLSPGFSKTQQCLGLNIRMADYSAINETKASELGGVFIDLLEKLNTDPQVIPIDLRPGGDWAATWRALRVPAPGTCNFAIPTDAVGAASRCRLVITASYHAAVFALGQGIPVVGLASSPYYYGKFNGLTSFYGDSCRMVDLANDKAMESLQTAALTLWRESFDRRNTIRDVSAEIVSNCEAAYDRYFVERF